LRSHETLSNHDGRDTEALGGLADGQLAVARPGGRVGNLAPPQDPLNALARERASFPGAQASGVELLGDLRAGVIGRQASGQLDAG
jgi:hypothetical protein